VKLSRPPHDDWHNCRPAFVELKEGEVAIVLPDEHPTMQKVLAIWETFTPAQRYTYHNVMCCNSRDPVDLTIVHGLVKRLTSSAQ